MTWLKPQHQYAGEDVTHIFIYYSIGMTVPYQIFSVSAASLVGVTIDNSSNTIGIVSD